MERKEQNKALENWAEFKKDIKSLDEFVTKVILRGSYDSGKRKAPPTHGDPEAKTQTTHYTDDTGEKAVRRPVDDSVRLKIVAMAKHIEEALNLAKNVIDIKPPTDVVERAMLSIPDCTACGDPISGKLFYGRWDNKCRQRFQKWVADGNAPDEKMAFEIYVKTHFLGKHQE